MNAYLCRYCDHAESDHEPGDRCLVADCTCGFFGYALQVGDRVRIATIPQFELNNFHGVVVQIDDDPDDVFTVCVRMDSTGTYAWMDTEHVWLCPHEVVPETTQPRN